jgi:hypothetical protein
VRDLPVPGPAGHPTVWKTNVFGSTFAVTVYADALIVSFPGTPRELFLGTVSLSTNQGGALILSKEWLRNEHSLTLDVPKNSRTVCVACEVFRKTIVEFIARPRWVTGTNRLSELRNGTP